MTKEEEAEQLRQWEERMRRLEKKERLDRELAEATRAEEMRQAYRRRRGEGGP